MKNEMDQLDSFQRKNKKKNYNTKSKMKMCYVRTKNEGLIIKVLRFITTIKTTTTMTNGKKINENDLK